MLCFGLFISPWVLYICSYPEILKVGIPRIIIAITLNTRMGTGLHMFHSIVYPLDMTTCS